MQTKGRILVGHPGLGLNGAGVTPGVGVLAAEQEQIQRTNYMKGTLMEIVQKSRKYIHKHSAWRSLYFRVQERGVVMARIARPSERVKENPTPATEK